ncbi:MAG: primosomal protein N' [Firmicutes bacterium]|nr:primosomal protein N' [Bacillota bacterium]
MTYVSVVVDNNTNATDELYTYRWDLPGQEPCAGCKIIVPFSIHDRRTEGYVAKVLNEAPAGVKRFKNVLETLPEEGLTREAMETALWMKSRYVCRYIEAVKCFLPGNTQAKRKTKDPFAGIEETPEEPKDLNADQKKALDAIASAIGEQRNGNFLLFGVTGSGKTEVYLQAMERVLQQGRQGIVLVPEISLTPQTVGRFVNRFGKARIAVLHSKLTPAQKSVEYGKIRRGEVDVVIGARSAVFAPFDKLGLIVIDEEHESSYKSESGAKYDAMEVAMKRAKAHGAALVLGSATPSATDFYRSEQGIFQRLDLPLRYNRVPLPRVRTVDMREEVKAGNRSLFSKELADALELTLAEKKQAILFLNRRGYSSFVSCRECGYVPRCPECGISLTYHKEEGALVCHYCGRKEAVPRVCPTCKSKIIGRFGAGTEQVEEKARELFPEAKIERLDLDAVRKKGSLEGILKRFADGRTDILIGTQLVAKGLDIANVALVGIISADVTLNIPDYRSGERTFQLVTQAAGRAGRGDEQGEVIIQTYSPESAVIQAAADQDYRSFYEREIVIREAALYPPFSDLFRFVVWDEDENRAMDSASRTAAWLRKALSSDYIVMGPSAAPIAKQSGMTRYQVIVKAPAGKRKECSAAAARLRKVFEEEKSAAKLLTMDINPFSFI